MLGIDQLFEELLRKKWVVGATNYDEDLHFSTYYVRALYRGNTNDLYQGCNSPWLRWNALATRSYGLHQSHRRTEGRRSGAAWRSSPYPSPALP